MAILDDGFSTTISLANGTTLKEVSVTPPGIDGGEAIPITTMRNSAWRTFAPRSLKTLSPMTFVAAYAPSHYTTIIGDINVNQSITVTFSDGDTLVFYGFIQSFVPGELTEGGFPTATVTITPTLWTGAHVETAPASTGGGTAP